MPSPRSEDALPAMSGHAACAVQDKIYLFGGRQNRKYLQRTYVFDTGDALSARRDLSQHVEILWTWNRPLYISLFRDHVPDPLTSTLLKVAPALLSEVGCSRVGSAAVSCNRVNCTASHTLCWRIFLS